MRRRGFMAWATPVIVAVTLPVHAQTTDDVGVGVPRTASVPTTLPPATTLPPSTTTLRPEEPGLCDDKPHKLEICHHPAKPGTDPFEICVAKPAVPAHIKNHGDYPGRCK